MTLGVNSYSGRSNLLRIEGNLNNNSCVREALQPEIISFIQDIPGANFQQDNARPHVAKTVRDFCLDMSPIERVWDLVGWRLARDLPPSA
ncbi:transposable element Tc1 transposase [Trichonephila clavipes]|nr:transposable element Tc1 transposase [Trichonephila clavipes]